MGQITVVGVGWTAGQLTLDAAEALRSGAHVLLHTDHCGCAQWLSAQGISYESLDGLYEACDDFDEHAERAASAVMDAAKAGDVVYGVLDVRDRSANRLMSLCRPLPKVIAGPPVEGALLACLEGESICVEASEWERFHPAARQNCLIREIDSRELAAEVKLRLMEVYPEEGEIWLLCAGSVPERMPLYALDRADRYDHTTCALVPAARALTLLERFDFEHLNEIMRLLCSPSGCPWDRVQTHESLKPYILEEAYEVIGAIDEGDTDHLYDELGDMLLQVALHAEIARKHGEFEMGDVTTAICEKMIHRHSHIFGGDHVENAEEVAAIWAKNKMAERGQHTCSETMREVTRALPATLRAGKVLKRARNAGMGEMSPDSALATCRRAFEAYLASPDEKALGRALMALCQAAAQSELDPEIALNGAIDDFIRKFEALEASMAEKGESFDALSPETLRKYWDLVKL